MFNRVILIVITCISILWIGYVGYDLLDRKDRITPQTIFDSRDGEILIINRSQEMSLQQVEFEPTEKMRLLLEKILENPTRNERFYISKKRDVLLIEMPSLWTESKITTYFSDKKMTLQKSGDGFQLEGGFLLNFKRNYISISVGEIERTSEELNWPIWDKKATASIIQLNQPLRSTDVYFKADGTISYQTRFGKDIHSKKIDDQDLFAELLPNKLKNYHFYEKKFAAAFEVIDEKSPLYQWSESGFVFFQYQGKKCILSDYLSGQDPFAILQELTGSDEAINGSTAVNFKQIRLAKNFPSDLNAGFYMMKLADKVVISESKEACQQIVADHTLGKTVALTELMRLKIFQKLPRKVSERYVSGKTAFAQSSYKNMLIKTVLARLVDEEVPEEKPEEVEELSWSQSIDGEAMHFLGRGNQQFIWTSAGKLISIQGKKKRWQMAFDGNVINEPQFVDLLDNGQKQLLFNTNSTIYLVDLNGQAHDGFPVKLDNEAVNSVSYFRWKGVGNFLLVDAKNQLIHFDNKGRELDAVKINVGDCKNPVDVFNQKGNIVAVVSGSEKTQTVNLLRHKVMKSHGSLPQNRVTIKENAGPNYYAFSRGQLQRSDYTGAEITLANYPDAQNLKLIEGENFKYIAFTSYNKIHVLNERGIKMFQFDIPFRELASFDVITLQNGKTYVAMIDGIENNLFVYDNKGKSYTPKPLEGKSNVFLSEKGSNNLVVNTTGDGFIVQYFDVLKTK